jgi:vancomycin permeability regulator SanA
MRLQVASKNYESKKLKRKELSGSNHTRSYVKNIKKSRNYYKYRKVKLLVHSKDP